MNTEKRPADRHKGIFLLIILLTTTTLTLLTIPPATAHNIFYTTQSDNAINTIVNGKANAIETII